MKKIFILFILFILAFNLSGNEKIIKILKKSKFPFYRFYLKDIKGNINYGFYEINKFTFQTADNTIEPYNGIAETSLIKKMGIAYCIFAPSLPWGIIGTAAGGIFTIAGILTLIDTFTRPDSFLQYYDPARAMFEQKVYSISFISAGSVLFILGIVLIAIASYNGYKYFKARREIIDILNKRSISILNAGNFKLSFSADIKPDHLFNLLPILY